MNKEKKILNLLALMLVMVLMLSGCGKSNGNDSLKADTGSEDTDQKGTEKVLIGVSMGYITDVFDMTMYNGILEFGEKNKDKAELQILNAQGDMNMQLTNVDQLITSKADVILIKPIDMDALTPAVVKANESSIPVVCVNTRTNGGDYVYVGSDDIEAGRIQGEWLAENLPQDATYCYIMGLMGHSGQIGRKKGLEGVLGADRPDVKMLSEQSANWDRSKALTIAEDWLKAYPDVTAIISQDDEMALGAIEALRTANKLESVLVIGIDATEEACLGIKAGELKMSVFQNAQKQGYEGAQTAYKIALDEWNGDDVVIPFELVDETNVDEYIAFYKEAKSEN